jgi:AbrB family looped-hinge helix DNA binding protein
VKQYQAVVSSKGQLVIPKDLRDRFCLVTGSRLKITVEDERIVLHPRSIGDEMEEFIALKLKENGQPVTKENISRYQQIANQAFDRMIAEAKAEYDSGNVMTLNALKRELDNV